MDNSFIYVNLVSSAELQARGLSSEQVEVIMDIRDRGLNVIRDDVMSIPEFSGSSELLELMHFAPCPTLRSRLARQGDEIGSSGREDGTVKGDSSRRNGDQNGGNEGIPQWARLMMQTIMEGVDR